MKKNIFVSFFITCLLGMEINNNTNVQSHALHNKLEPRDGESIVLFGRRVVTSADNLKYKMEQNKGILSRELFVEIIDSMPSIMTFHRFINDKTKDGLLRSFGQQSFNRRSMLNKYPDSYYDATSYKKLEDNELNYKINKFNLELSECIGSYKALLHQQLLLFYTKSLTEEKYREALCGLKWIGVLDEIRKKLNTNEENEFSEIKITISTKIITIDTDLNNLIYLIASGSINNDLLKESGSEVANIFFEYFKNFTITDSEGTQSYRFNLIIKALKSMITPSLTLVASLENKVNELNKIEPIETRENTESIETEKNTESIEIGRNIKPIEIVKNTESIETEKNIEPIKIGKNTESIETEKNTESIEIGRNIKPIEIVKNTESSKIEPIEIGKNIEPIEIGKNKVIELIRKKLEGSSDLQIKKHQKELNEGLKKVTNQKELNEILDEVLDGISDKIQNLNEKLKEILDLTRLTKKNKKEIIKEYLQKKKNIKTHDEQKPCNKQKEKKSDNVKITSKGLKELTKKIKCIDDIIRLGGNERIFEYIQLVKLIIFLATKYNYLIEGNKSLEICSKLFNLQIHEKPDLEDIDLKNFLSEKTINSTLFNLIFGINETNEEEKKAADELMLSLKELCGLSITKEEGNVINVFFRVPNKETKNHIREKTIELNRILKETELQVKLILEKKPDITGREKPDITGCTIIDPFKSTLKELARDLSGLIKTVDIFLQDISSLTGGKVSYSQFPLKCEEMKSLWEEIQNREDKGNLKIAKNGLNHALEILDNSLKRIQKFLHSVDQIDQILKNNIYVKKQEYCSLHNSYHQLLYGILLICFQINNEVEINSDEEGVYLYLNEDKIELKPIIKNTIMEIGGIDLLNQSGLKRKKDKLILKVNLTQKKEK